MSVKHNCYVCGKLKRTRSLLKLNSHKDTYICLQCNNRVGGFKAIQESVRLTKYYSRRRCVLSQEESTMLASKYKNEGLSDKLIGNKLYNLKGIIIKERKKQKEEEAKRPKKTFAQDFAETSKRKER